MLNRQTLRRDINIIRVRMYTDIPVRYSAEIEFSVANTHAYMSLDGVDIMNREEVNNWVKKQLTKTL